MGHRTGVHDNQIGLLALLGFLELAREKLLPNTRTVCLVGSAAERRNVEFLSH
jgi:hypothetical protein